MNDEASEPLVRVLNMAASDAASQRLLPFDVTVPTPRSIGDTGYEKQPTPPSYDEIADRIAPEYDQDRWFSLAEQRSAAWLRS